MFHSIIFLLVVNAISSSYCYFESKDLEIEDIIIESTNYPNSAPPNNQQKWMLRVPSQNQIELYCFDFRTYERNPCLENNSFSIVDEGKVKTFCGTQNNFRYISVNPIISVKFLTDNYGGGFIKCSAKLYGTRPDRPYLNETSLEFDTREYGVTEGKVKPTCHCGWANKVNSRIINGTETNVNEFPFMVALRSKDGLSTALCGGTILTEYHVLTAAHCTMSMTPLSITYGEHNHHDVNEWKNRNYINVKQIIIHENYKYKDTYLLNDISILVLEKPIVFSQIVGPACLPNKKSNLVGEYVKAIGWGQEYTDGTLNSGKLQKANMRILDLEICKKDFNNNIDLNFRHQLCVFSKTSSTCFGDSGGPIVWVEPNTNRYTIVGIPSFLRKCGIIIPTVATDVMAFLDWIEKKIQLTVPDVSTCKSQN